jgi:hypothetical protein
MWGTGMLTASDIRLYLLGFFRQIMVWAEPYFAWASEEAFLAYQK